MDERIETASLMDDADVEAWWAPNADFTGRLVAAIAVACAAVPELNARYDRGSKRFEPLPTVDLGIAIETDHGVRVPVLADICHAPFAEIRRRLDRLRAIISDHSPRPSVTLVNFGRGPCRYAVLPIVPPQVAIVSAGRAVLQAEEENGRTIHRHRLPLTLAYDTRACGLAAAARFIGIIKTDLARRELPLERGWQGCGR